ncbi:DMT family transporter [Rhizobium halophytocola]|uniref:S-adenosylmethionine uptake transporter n=1 Tax=Rhizobium halophytocola TaxID=735519 RepID=A0ABS4DY75_9HYPH|nr:DMT family transporter [Rhizobium halophytocola]MBP1850633.1 S-adenosylmethionine uptake transporter [Rhizobium halophytocola]
MNQSVAVLLRSPAVIGASYMVAAGVVFAAINIVTQWLAMQMAFPAASVAFWQYGFALVLSLPLLFRLGLRAMKTAYPWRHVVRVLLAALGVQTWLLGLASVPIWQAIALVMTSPFFIIVGARVFLGERVGAARWGATLAGFTGAMLILSPWSDSFTPAALLPIASAFLWGGSSLLMKNLTAHEPAETVTVWLLVMLTPINAGLALADGLVVPGGLALVLLLSAGLLTAIGQYLLTLAYSAADATYVQPFDDLKLPLNVAAGFIVFGYAPADYFWIGALLILSASLFLMRLEIARGRAAVA